MSKIFLDTNILLYALDPRDMQKQQRAAQAILTATSAPNEAVISTQVLQEFYSVATRKLHISAPLAQREVQNLLRMKVVTLVPAFIEQAIALSISDTIHFWDALLVVAANSIQCEQLWSEDLQTNRHFGALTIINPLD